MPRDDAPIMVPVDGQTQWLEVFPGHFRQSAYGAANRSGDFDGFVDFWGGLFGEDSATTTQHPEPFVVLPLERYVGNQTETDRVLCVTCHNPHGNDLYNPSSAVEPIENDMLRLHDRTNALCNACHPN